MKPMLKLVGLCVLSFSLSQSALAMYQSNVHPYIGLEAGGSNLHYEKQFKGDDVLSVHDQGVAGRLFAGIDLNQNVGFELGYTRYQNPEFKIDNDFKANFSQQSLDLLAKLSVPVANCLNLYAKAGMAYVLRNDAQLIDNDIIVKINDSDSRLRPMLGLGASYKFTRNLIGNVGYYRTFGVKNLPDADFYGAGITVQLG